MSQPVSIVIPTYMREQVLVDTIGYLLALETRAAEILVIDQTPAHTPAVERRLSGWDESGSIRWIRQPEPSIPRAMNRGLLEARHTIVLYLDDDVIPSANLVVAHAAAFSDDSIWAVQGQVLQPGEEPVDASDFWSRRRFAPFLDFRFNHVRGQYIENFIAANMSIRRDSALAVGGFDENFTHAAHRFETEFARRLVRRGGRIWFEPQASVRHLKAPSGGIRSYGERLRVSAPHFTVGEYYFALLQPERSRWWYIVTRPFRAVRTKFHLRHPWTIPGRLFAELRGFRTAYRMYLRGQNLIEVNR